VEAPACQGAIGVRYAKQEWRLSLREEEPGDSRSPAMKAEDFVSFISYVVFGLFYSVPVFPLHAPGS
jgi:hypothetical protein